RARSVVGHVHRRAHELEKESQAVRRVLVVIDDKDPPPGQRRAWIRQSWLRSRWRLGQRFFQRQSNRKFTALARSITGDFHAAAVHFGQTLHERKPNSQPP